MGSHKNDTSDADIGPNNFQNFPVITAATPTTVSGTLHSTPNTSFTAHLYVNNTCDTSGFGEGESLLTSFIVTTDGAGNASFIQTSLSLTTGQFVTATATDSSGNTSEFSACFHVPVDNTPVVTIVASDPTADETGTNPGSFTFTRTGPTVAALDVNFTLGGTATPDVDYGNIIGTLVSIPVGQSSVTVNFTPSLDGLVEPDETVVVTLTAGTYIIGTPNTATATIIENVTPAAVELSLTLSDSPDPVLAGQNVIYTFAVTNNGPSPATNVTLIGGFDAGLTFVSATGGCAFGVPCSMGTIAPGASSSINVTMRVDTDEPVAASGIVSASESDLNPANNVDTETTTVTPNVGQIAGTVRSAGGAPLAGVNVQIVDPLGDIVHQRITAADGTYTTEPLPVSVVPELSLPYYVRVVNVAGHVNATYGCPTVSCGVQFGTPITLAGNGATTSGIDFNLVAFGSISGTASTITSTPVSGSTILIFNADDVANNFPLVGNTSTLANGTYTISLAPGRYYVRSLGGPVIDGTIAAPQFFNGINCLGCLPSDGSIVFVSSGQQTSGINFTHQAGDGRITGTITNAATNAPLSGVTVHIFTATGEILQVLNTNGAGLYQSTGLPNGQYFVKTANFSSSGLGPAFNFPYIDELYGNFPCPFGCAITTGTPVTIAGANATGIDIALSPGGQITGTVTDATNGESVNGQVQIFRANGQFASFATTGNGGTYFSTGLPDGTYYLRTNVSGEDPFIDALYGGQPCLTMVGGLPTCDVTTGTPVVIAGGASATGINLALNYGGLIQGRLTNEVTGAPLPSILQTGNYRGARAAVGIFNSAGQLVTQVATDQDGRYLTSRALPPGSYYARTGTFGVTIDEAFGNVPCLGEVCDVLSGTPIVVTPVVTASDFVTSGIDFALAVGGSIESTIVGASTGVPTSATLAVYDASGQLVSNSSAFTTAGVAVSRGLPPGNYFAKTTDTPQMLLQPFSVNGSVVHEVYDNVLCLPGCAVNTGTPIALTTNTTTPIPFALDRSLGRIMGYVTEASTGALLSFVPVEIYNANGTLVTTVTSRSTGPGYFASPGLLAGTYYLRTRNTLGYTDVLYNGQECAGECNVTLGTPVTVGQPTAGIVLALGASNQQVVTISSADPTADEIGDPGAFTVTRTGSTADTLVVHYTVSGTATNGLDYGELSGSVTIPAGQASVSIPVNPVDDTLQESVESVVLTLEPDAAYTVGVPNQAVVAINSDLADTLFEVTNTNDSGAGSLRQAIIDANAAPDTNFIFFTIPGSGPFTIQPTTPLPVITSPAYILATTQPGYTTTPIVELSGALAGAGADGLVISGGGSVISGFVINRWSGRAVYIHTGHGNVLTTNYIGTDVTGTVALGNGGAGAIHIVDSASNFIGGGSIPTGNLISGNSGNGIRIDGALASINVVYYNQIGLTSALGALGNTFAGIYVRRASGTVITGNEIRFNGSPGAISICGDATTCPGGDFGTPGNNASGTTIYNNVVTNNIGAGIWINGAPNALIGTVAGGTNNISGNGFGTSPNIPLPGIVINGVGATDNQIVGNAINANNTGGIVIVGGANTRNRLQSNTFVGNGGLAIDLGSATPTVFSTDGVSPNDPGDGDTGPNTRQNFPIITQALGNGSVQGTLNSVPNSTFTLDFYGSTTCNASGADAQRILGSFLVATDASGNVTFTNTLTSAPTLGEFVNATATDLSGNTSELSSCFQVTANALTASLSFSVQPTNTGAGSVITPAVTVLASDSAGQPVANVSVTLALVGGGTLSGTLTQVTGPTGLAAFNNLSVDAIGNGKALQATATGYASATSASFNSLDLTIVVTNTSDSGSGSLRQALLDANVSPDTNTITFNIPGPGPYTIEPLTSLPTTTAPLVIDGTTQPGFSGTPIIELSGALAGPAIGLTIAGGNSTVRGLVINRWVSPTFQPGGIGLLIPSGANTIVVGNYIGTDVAGSAGVPSTLEQSTNTWIHNPTGNRLGIRVTAPNTRIGGTTAADRNLISGNSDTGIRATVLTAADGVTVTSSATGTVIQGNYFGTDVTGTSAKPNGAVRMNGGVPNALAGSSIDVQAPNVTIGGTAAGSGNLITANAIGVNAGVLTATGGVVVTTGSAIVIQGNLIGTNASGTAALPFNTDLTLFPTGSRGTGIQVTTPDAVIGGSAAGAGNVISGNASYGINSGISFTNPGTGNVLLSSATNLTVQGNRIGTNAAGGGAIAGSGNIAGLLVNAPNAHIGGTAVGAGNMISGNGGYGIQLFGFAAPPVVTTASNATIERNWIGLSASGTTALPNGIDGINLAALNGTIAGNIISGNVQDGIDVVGFGSTIIRGNWIGLASNGTSPVANGSYGVFIRNDSTNNTVGGINATDRNVISGNQFGVGILGANSGGNVVAGNYIGLNTEGSAPVPNTGVQSGIHINGAPNNTIGGTVAGARNVVSGNSQHAISVTGAGSSGNLVQGNYVGLNPAGTAAIPNGGIGIDIVSALNTTVGGEGLARNVISGNGLGIQVRASAAGNTIRGNYIGTNAAGSAAVINGGDGVFFDGGATNNLIGGTDAGARNVISGNGGQGINLTSATGPGNVISGNFIGTDASGSVAVANARSGIVIAASNTTVGGTAAGAGNVISGNGNLSTIFFGGGVQISGGSNIVQGNFIGTNASGTAALGNKSRGIEISNSSDNTIGGTTAGARNIISGNGTAGGGAGIGVFSPGTNNQILGNYIGTDVTGTNAIPNTFGGVFVRGGGMVVGGVAAGAGNLIAFNTGAAGVLVLDGGVNSPIRGNQIFSNAGLGIDLAVGVSANGVTPNDAGDGDAGPNNLQNFPVITQATAGSTSVQGTLNSAANATFNLDFYASSTCDASTFGEGQRFLGSGLANTDGTGNATFSLTMSSAPAAGEFVTATATDPLGNTSEFSTCFQIPIVSGSLSFPVQPSTTIAGQIITPAVTVLATDTAGQPVANLAVTLSLVGAGSLSGTLTRTTGPPGLAVFDDLSSSTTATGYTLQAAASGFTSTTSTSFDIVGSLDTPIVTVTASDAAASEIGPNTGTFSFTRSGPTTSALVVNFTRAGTATAGSDYINFGLSVTIPVGQTTATITVTPNDDALVEATEDIVITLTDGTLYDLGAAGTETATVTIADGDVQPIVTVTASDAAASEIGPDTGTFTITRTGDLQVALVVNFTRAGTATPGSDYINFGLSVTIPVGQTTATITVTPNDDALVEATEDIVITLTDGSLYDLGAAGTETATVTIADGDVQPIVTVTATDSTASEIGPNTGTLTFTRTGDLQVALVVNFTRAGTATAGSDYINFGLSVTIPVGQTTATITVTPNDDALVEATEDIVITLTDGTLYDLGAAGTETATVTIADGDVQPIVTVTASDAAASEIGPDTGTFTITRTGDLQVALVVNFTRAGTATPGTDYTNFGLAVTIPVNQTTITITVTPNDDVSVEGPEDVVIDLTDGTLYDLGTPATATVTITDNITPVITVTATDAEASEIGANAGTFTFTRTGDISLALNGVTYTRTGSALGGTDFTPNISVSSSVNFLAGSATATVTLTPVNDALVEGDETIIFTITDGANWDLGTPGTEAASITITDNVTPVITVAATDATASEIGPDSGTLTFTRTGDISLALNGVTYTRTGTALGGTDFTPNISVSSSVNFLAGSTTATVTLTPVNDVLVEGDETIVFTLTDGANWNVGTPPTDTATITITDNLTPVITVAVTDATASEIGPDAGTFTFTRTGDISLALNGVTYTRTGTALGGTDFTPNISVSSSVNFLAGSATATVTLTPVNDVLVEGDETIVFTLTDGANWNVGTPPTDTATITITDNVTPVITVTATDATASEIGPDAGTFTFTRTGDISLALNGVTYTRTGTALGGTDFTPNISVSGSVNFLAGSATATVTLTPVNDALVEGDETIIFTLTDGANWNTGTPPTDTATVTISDAVSDEGTLINGFNHTGSISTAGEVDLWTFTATAGDSISLSIAETGVNSTFIPWIRLLGPTAALVSGGSSSGDLVGQINVAAPLTGTYTVQVASNDAGNDNTGDYVLILAHTPGAAVVPAGDEGGALLNGANHQGAIFIGDLDQWTFTANAGDSISLSISEAGANSPFAPWIRLRGPSGALVSGGSVSGDLVATVDVVAGATGTYTVLVASNDSGNDATGNYVLTLAQSPEAFVVPAGDQGGALTNGANHTGTITLGDIDQWSFTATAGGSISLSISEAGGNSAFVPWIRLRGPGGGLVSGGSASGALVGTVDVVAPATGTYTVLVASNDSGNVATGNYVLTLAQSPEAFVVPAGDEGGALTNGANHTGTITLGDIDQWSFTATAGGSISLSISEAGGNSAFVPWIRLRGPGGGLVSGGSASGALVGTVDVVAPATGTYSVLVASNDSGNVATGNYVLTLAQSPEAFVVPAGDEGGALTNGANHTGTITLGDIDQWSFTANAGDSISLSVSESGGNSEFVPWIRLRGPSGGLVSGGSASGDLVGTVDVVAQATGTYSVLVASNDSGNDATGNFVLTLAHTPEAFVVPEGDEGGTLTSGVAHTGTITVGDLDQWSFTATAGETISLTISEVGANTAFVPWIRLRGPSGALVSGGSASGDLSAQINVTAQTNGTYTVVVASNDSGNDAGGDYELTRN